MNRRHILWIALCATLWFACQASAQQQDAAKQTTKSAGITSGAEAAKKIDWTKVEHGAPIPHQMPVADADTGIDSGFAPQWIQRSITNWAPSIADPNLPSRIVLRIAKTDRRPNDSWARDMQNRLRTTMRMNADPAVLQYSRVFCNSEGCLCYFEIPPGSPSTRSFNAVVDDLSQALTGDSGWGKEMGIAYVNQVGEAEAWDLIYIIPIKPRG